MKSGVGVRARRWASIWGEEWEKETNADEEVSLGAFVKFEDWVCANFYSII